MKKFTVVLPLLGCGSVWAVPVDRGGVSNGKDYTPGFLRARERVQTETLTRIALTILMLGIIGSCVDYMYFHVPGAAHPLT